MASGYGRTLIFLRWADEILEEEDEEEEMEMKREELQRRKVFLFFWSSLRWILDL